MESPLPPGSKMVHIIEIGCAQNGHKAWKNWAKIGLFGARGGGIFKKLKREAILDQKLLALSQMSIY